MSDESSTCPNCGADLPDGAPAGLCPRCLMAGAMQPTEAGVATPKPESPSIDEVQSAFPQLQIEEMIGEGGMGVVFRAKQTSLNRDVALKLLAPHREKQPGFAERFTREAQALAAMNHPNIVTVYDFGQENGFFYLLMEYVDGVNLRQAIAAGKFTPQEALAIVPHICEALQYAHDRGIVHRDIKPENLLLDKEGGVKVADFGIARILREPDPDTDANDEISDASLTAGTALGTPDYMAPEQAAAPQEVDHRADIYSLGVVFFEMLTGERPTGPIARPSNRVKVDIRVDEIVMRALEAAPEMRWQTANELQTEVETVVADSPPPPPPKPASATPAAAGPVAPKKNRGWAWGCGIAALVCGGLFVMVALVALLSWAGYRSKGAEASAMEQLAYAEAAHAEALAAHAHVNSTSQMARPSLNLLINELDVTKNQTNLKFNFLKIEEGYDLVLETRGAVVQVRRDGERFEEEVDLDLARFSRLHIHQGGSVRFDYEEMQSHSQHPDSQLAWNPNVVEVHPHKPTLLFRLVNNATNDRVEAILKIVPSGSLAEIHPTEEGVYTSEPGTPHPPAPDGALFVAERRVAFPHGMVVRVSIEESVRDDRSKNLTEPLIFKAPDNDARGIAIRWRAYPPDHSTHADQYLVDLVAEGSGVTFYRYQGEFDAEEIVIRSPDVLPLPHNADLATLAQSNHAITFRLLRANEPVPEGFALKNWWDIRAEIYTLGGRATGDESPAFQLPNTD